MHGSVREQTWRALLLHNDKVTWSLVHGMLSIQPSSWRAVRHQKHIVQAVPMWVQMLTFQDARTCIGACRSGLDVPPLRMAMRSSLYHEGEQ